MSDAAEASVQGMVLYSDGGARPTNPGFAGYGMHGYLYKTDKPKKGIGVTGMTVTADGYQKKIDTEDYVVTKNDEDLMEETGYKVGQVIPRKFDAATPISYFSGYGALGPGLSNNYAELLGAVRSLQHAAQYDVKRVDIISDSEYVVKGANENVAKWVAARWLQPDGQVRKNADTWKELITARNVLLERGAEVRFTWIESHCGYMGNVEADALATSAVMRSMSGKREESIDTKPADGYWAYDGSRHPLLFQRRVYFNTVPDAIQPGQYYTGDHGKDDDAAGTRVSDGCYAVVKVDESDEAIDVVRNYQAKICGGLDHIAFIRVDNLFRQHTHRQVMDHREFSMVKKYQNKDDLYTLDDEPTPMTKVLNPARNSIRIIEELSALEEKLSWYKSQDPRATLTNVTSILYETVVKTSKNGETTTHMLLKEQYNVGYAALRLEANYVAADRTIQALPVTLNLGIDMPDRNALKRLETLDPVVTLISWRESDQVFRYAVLVETKTGMGIYAGVYSNIRIVDAPTTAA